MKSLNTYSRKRFKRLLDLLKSVEHSDNIEILHKIRVEIKKLKAILGLIQFKFPALNTHKLFIPLRTIFRKAGEIREPYIIENLLLHYGMDNSGSLILPPKKSIKLLKEKLPGFLKSVKKTKKKILKKAKKINRKDLHLYLTKQEKIVANKLFPTLNIETLHKARKYLKEILHLSSIEDRNHVNPFLSTSAELIGQWNDKQIIIRWLSEQGPSKNELIKKVNRAGKGDLQSLTKLVNDYYTSEKSHQ